MRQRDPSRVETRWRISLRFGGLLVLLCAAFFGSAALGQSLKIRKSSGSFWIDASAPAAIPSTLQVSHDLRLDLYKVSREVVIKLGPTGSAFINSVPEDFNHVSLLGAKYYCRMSFEFVPKVLVRISKGFTILRRRILEMFSSDSMPFDLSKRLGVGFTEALQ